MKHLFNVQSKTLQIVAETPDILLSIILFLQAKDLCILQLVAKSVAEIVVKDTIWKNLVDVQLKGDKVPENLDISNLGEKAKFMKIREHQLIKKGEENEDNFRVEYSRSSRAKCRKCSENIPTGFLRLGFPVIVRGHIRTHLYYHFHCGVDRLNLLHPSTMDGYSDLVVPHRRLLEACFQVRRKEMLANKFAETCGVIAVTCDVCNIIPSESYVHCSECKQDLCFSCKPKSCKHKETCKKRMNTLGDLQCQRCCGSFGVKKPVMFSEQMQLLICGKCFNNKEDQEKGFKKIGKIKHLDEDDTTEELLPAIDFAFMQQFLPPGEKQTEETMNTFWKTCLYSSTKGHRNPISTHFFDTFSENQNEKKRSLEDAEEGGTSPKKQRTRRKTQ